MSRSMKSSVFKKMMRKISKIWTNDLRERKGLFCVQAMMLVFLIAGCGQQKKVVAPAAETKPAASTEQKPETAAQKKEKAKLAAETVYKMLREQNPFRVDHAIRHEVMSVTSQPNNPLKGIIWDAQAPYAIVGSRIVRVGDFIGEKRVIKIDENSVTLEEITGEKEVLRLR